MLTCANNINRSSLFNSAPIRVCVCVCDIIVLLTPCRIVILPSPLLQTLRLSGLFSIGEDLDDEVISRKHT